MEPSGSNVTFESDTWSFEIQRLNVMVRHTVLDNLRDVKHETIPTGVKDNRALNGLVRLLHGQHFELFQDLPQTNGFQFLMTQQSKKPGWTGLPYYSNIATWCHYGMPWQWCLQPSLGTLKRLESYLLPAFKSRGPGRRVHICRKKMSLVRHVTAIHRAGTALRRIWLTVLSPQMPYPGFAMLTWLSLLAFGLGGALYLFLPLFLLRNPTSRHVSFYILLPNGLMCHGMLSLSLTYLFR